MNTNKLLNMFKMVIFFLICTVIFYGCLLVLQIEYEQNHRYDLPEGPSIKVHRLDE